MRLNFKSREHLSTITRVGNSLQNTDVRGQRYLTEKSRRLTKQARDREEFLKELQQMRTRDT
jgi:hypothetical protein